MQFRTQFTRWIAPSVVCGLILIAAHSSPLAHPVAQGSMDVVVARGVIRLSARVSMEEVIVSNTQGTATPPSSTQEAIERHGFYLLNHIVLSADDAPLVGRMVSAAEEDSSARDKALYEFEYALPPNATPARIKLQQNVLSEFDFAPGNPWEAFYQVRLGMENSGTIEGLLGNKNPVTFGCTWKAAKSEQSSDTQTTRVPVRVVEIPAIAIVGGAIALILLGVVFALRRK